MTRGSFLAVTFFYLFVGFLPAQTPSGIPQEESKAAPSAPASTEMPTDPPAVLPSEAPTPMPGNGTIEAYNHAPSNGPGAGLWISADYLLGWFEPARLPPLVTTSRAGTARARAGVLGLASTSILFDGGVNDDVRSGLQFGVGYWFDPERTFGLEASFSVFESQSTLFSASSTGTPILARPFTNAVTGLPTSVVIAFPGSGSGAVAVRDSSGNFYEFHLDLSERICGNEWFRLDGLVGYRFYRYDEGLRIEQTISPTGGAFARGTQITATDSFVAENEFNAFDLGFRTEARVGNWTVDFLTKLATGGIFQDVRIRGNTTTTVPGVAPVMRSGGVLALSSNIGDHRHEEWTIFPEFGAHVSWRITPLLQLRAGYSFLFMNDIVRAHDQVNLTVNPGLFPPPTAAAGSPNEPSFTLHRGDVWIQAINLGLEYTF